MTAPLEIADPAEMAEALAALDEADRRALTPLIRAADPAPALAVAGAACLPRAADVVGWLRSPKFDQPVTDAVIAAVVRVIGLPGRPKPAAVAGGLAGKLRLRDLDRDHGRWRLAAATLRAAGLAPPATEPVVRGWIRDRQAATVEELTAGLAGDPWSATLLPALFELPHVAADLDETWAVALVRLTADGPLPRAELLRLVLQRLGAGDRTAALRPVTATYRLLDPTPDEQYPHRAAFLDMLGSARPEVAEIGQQALRALDEAGRLDAATVREAADRVLARSEKKLVRAHLSWLEGALDRHAEAAGPLLAAITRVLTGGPADLAAIALRLLRRHPEVLRPAAEGLTGYLRRMADEALGETTAQPARATGQPVPPPDRNDAAPGEIDGKSGAEGAAPGDGLPSGPGPDPAERMPPPLDSAAAVEAALAARDGAPLDPMETERLLAGVVAFADVYRDPDAVRALAPVDSAPESRMLAGRVNELADQLAAAPPPVLLATPHTRNGLVDPARILFRLAQAEQDGWQPGPYDLTQALLRLPPRVDPGIAAVAGRLTSPAGRRFASWLGGELEKADRTDPADLRKLVTALAGVRRAVEPVR